jgi:REP element-mobilizing transposase RayT
MSRVVGGAHLLHDVEKEYFRNQMWLLADFCGIEVITHTVMDNHFHLVLRTPDPAQPVADGEVRRRLAGLYGAKSPWVARADEEMQRLSHISESFRKQLLARMGDVSMYLKELKQRMTTHYNRIHERYGTLWAERFTSVLVEDSAECVQKVAAYVDLNAVRAGLVKDPKDYRFCGYAEAVAQDGRARQGLASCLKGETWKEKHQEYRSYFLTVSGTSSHSGKVVLTSEEIRAKLKNGAELSTQELLLLKVRYMRDGAVLGSKSFVEEMFVKFRRHFG